MVAQSVSNDSPPINFSTKLRFAMVLFHTKFATIVGDHVGIIFVTKHTKLGELMEAKSRATIGRKREITTPCEDTEEITYVDSLSSVRSKL